MSCRGSHGIAHRDVVKSYLGLLALGKSDFEAVSNMRKDPFFRQALDIARVPSAARLRLRLDQHAEALMEQVDVALVEFLKTAQVPITPLRTGHMSLDLDVFPLKQLGHQERRGGPYLCRLRWLCPDRGVFEGRRLVSRL